MPTQIPEFLPQCHIPCCSCFALPWHERVAAYVWLTRSATNIEVELVKLNIAKAEHLKPEYKAINPLAKIPWLVEDDFVLPESASILRYLANTNTIPEHWYPGVSPASISSRSDCLY